MIIKLIRLAIFIFKRWKIVKAALMTAVVLISLGIGYVFYWLVMKGMALL